MGCNGGGLSGVVSNFQNNFTPAGWLSGGDVSGAKAASDAADAQIAAGQDANAVQMRMFNQSQKDAQPYLDAGAASEKQLQSSMPDLTRKFTMNDFQADPAYQFNLNQGLQAVQRSAAARGGLNSMGTMQNLNNYAQGMASNEYGNAYNRFTQNQTQKYNMLSGQVGIGAGSAAALAGTGQKYAQQIGSNDLSMGNAKSAGIMAAHNGNMGMLNQATQLMSNPQMMGSMNGMLSGGMSSGGMAGLGGMGSYAGADAGAGSMATLMLA